MPQGEKRLSLEEWQRLKTQIFWCYEGHPPVVGGTTRFRTPNYSAWLVRRGEAEIVSRGKRCLLRPGNWVIVPPPGHERHFTENMEILSIHFRLTWEEGSDLFTLAEPVVFPGARHPALERATRRLRRFFEQVGTRGQFEAISRPLTMTEHLHFQTLAGRFALTLTGTLDAEGLLPASCYAPPDPQIRRILAQLEHSPLDHAWDNAAAATALGMSPGHLNRVFRQEFGQTPRQYFDIRRLEHAKSGVAAGRVSVKEVAASLGFSSAVFCRWFRQAVGASPTFYRQTIGRQRSLEPATR